MRIPKPELQLLFATELQRLKRKHLLPAFRSAIASTDLKTIDEELHQYAPLDCLTKLAGRGLRGELVFPVPTVLGACPSLLTYYRLLTGHSQKAFYVKDTGMIPFKAMESTSPIPPKIIEQLPGLCRAFSDPMAYLIRELPERSLTRELLHDLSLLSLGPQLRGGINNDIGKLAIQSVFSVIASILESETTLATTSSIQLNNAAGRQVLIAFAPDPDIVIQEVMGDGNPRMVLAIEIKGGTDRSNIHNRLGEAEKSHQKARAGGFRECWTIINVEGLDKQLAKTESPTTDRFYSLADLTSEEGALFEDFKHRIRSLIGI